MLLIAIPIWRDQSILAKATTPLCLFLALYRTGPDPTKVKDFVRKGPSWADGPRFLFTLKLEDDFGVVDAVAAGPAASRLLPGCPSPAEFLTSPDVRARVERVLAVLEAAGADGAGEGLVDLRLRSYLAPLVGIGQRGGKCKRYSIVAPSCLENGRRGRPAEG